jgi:pilus assembly protein CpaC
MENIMTYLPGFADIPILGMLFNSRRFQRRETELVIVITARLVNPVNSTELPPLPGMVGASDPSDVHVFLLNGFEALPPKAKRRKPSSPRSNVRVISESHSVGRTPSGRIGFWR